jgi:hypothetical protein
MPSGVSVATGTPTWLYGGRIGGWWKYDPITNQKIENGYQFYLSSLTSNTTPEQGLKLSESVMPEKKELNAPYILDSESESEDDPSPFNPNAIMTVLILNRAYSINFERMCQTPISGMGMSRPIKRMDGTEDVLVKGIAGLQIRDTSTPPPLDSVHTNPPVDSQVFVPDDM